MRGKIRIVQLHANITDLIFHSSEHAGVPPYPVTVTELGGPSLSSPPYPPPSYDIPDIVVGEFS